MRFAIKLWEDYLEAGVIKSDDRVVEAEKKIDEFLRPSYVA